MYRHAIAIGLSVLLIFQTSLSQAVGTNLNEQRLKALHAAANEPARIQQLNQEIAAADLELVMPNGSVAGIHDLLQTHLLNFAIAEKANSENSGILIHSSSEIEKDGSALKVRLVVRTNTRGMPLKDLPVLASTSFLIGSGHTSQQINLNFERSIAILSAQLETAQLNMSSPVKVKVALLNKLLISKAEASVSRVIKHIAGWVFVVVAFLVAADFLVTSILRRGQFLHAIGAVIATPILIISAAVWSLSRFVEKI